MSDSYPPQPPAQPGPPPGWQQPPPPKKKHTVRNVLLIITVLVFLGVAGCIAVIAGIGNEINKDAETEHTVIYKVTGAGGSTKGDLTYTTDGSTTTEQAQNAKLPWSKTLKIKGLLSVYQVSVQNSLGQKGKVTCSISLDGKVVKTATASGEGAIASCDYTK